MDVSEQGKLVERARHDREAFGQLYDQFYSQILGYVLRRVANIETAQDITSEVFFKALKNLGRYQSRDNVPFSSWLYRIATNQVNDHFRSKNRKHTVVSLEEASDTGDTISTSSSSVEAEVLQAEEELRRQEEFLILHESISKLPIKYQEVITLRYFEDKQEKEIAQILGRPQGTVKSLLHRGLRKLREMMG
jgi:RNA polymerase sigma-70 factor (ECF subfamily)